MNIVVKARHMDVTDAMREHVRAKAEKLPRYYDGLQSIDVTLDVDADKPFVEVVVTAKKKSTFVATQRNDDMYACIDQCIHKISEQLRRHKDKVRNRQGPSLSEAQEREAQERETQERETP